MPDALRESLFNILGSMLATPGTLPPIHVADLFAGGGSNGLEALSRGAVTCTFWERDPAALRILRENLDRLQAGPEASLTAGNAWHFAPPRDGGSAPQLVFLDPPYRDARDVSPLGHVPRLLERLAGCTAQPGWCVLHHEGAIEYPEHHWAGWSVCDRRSIGSHALTFFLIGS